MTEIRLEYFRERGIKNKRIYRPKISITFFGMNIESEVLSLIDSGSDVTIIPMDLANALGIEISDNEIEIDGIGGMAEPFKSKVTIKIDDLSPIPKMDLYVSKDSKWDFVLIGRNLFFEYFKITFYENRKRVYLVRSKYR